MNRKQQRKGRLDGSAEMSPSSYAKATAVRKAMVDRTEDKKATKAKAKPFSIWRFASRNGLLEAVEGFAGGSHR